MREAPWSHEDPAEDLLVERLRRHRVCRVQVAEVPRARGVGDLGAEAPLGLPEPELDAGRVGDGGVVPALAGLLDRVDQATARGLDRGDGGVDVVDGDVGAPRAGRCSGGLGGSTDAGDVLAVELGDDVAAPGCPAASPA